jgi:hypothetical protein
MSKGLLRVLRSGRSRELQSLLAGMIE